ncbi:hypothetical protein Lalb_Chr01g0020431 [Lupinus albus]|uniref:Uncharacterized protein n=1 Tax=Lupinus albus TaxID=3870 RepID=A0A6A4RA85_LUPAL|nr:hypothetical protein Lalb_Chr01g0020431 [Lupinus albus]
MSIYKYSGVLMYQKEDQTIVAISDEDEDNIPANQTQASQPDVVPTMPQAPSFGLTHLDAMEQHLNERIDNGMQAMQNRMQPMDERIIVELHRQKVETQGCIGQLSFAFNTIQTFFQPPHSN